MQMNEADNILIQTVIDSNLRKNGKYAAIEFVIRPECNQRCEYCYLTQHGHESYPDRYSKEQITHNFQLLINYLIKQQYKITKIDLFAGDMFYDDLFFELVEPLKKYFSFLLKTYPNEFKVQAAKREIFSIIIPCNMSFCHDDKKLEKVKQICQDFWNLGVKIFFSYSTDGRYASYVREKGAADDAFFDKVFQFCEELDYGCHPMVSYESIDDIFDNYEWFKIKLKQYRMNNGGSLPYFLEVRNTGWTPDTIESYCNFLRYVIADVFQHDYNSNVHSFLENVFKEYTIQSGTNHYNFSNVSQYGLYKLFVPVDRSAPCNLGLLDMTVNVGDLSLIPCHRLAYPELRGGRFIVENDEIIRLDALEGMNAYLHLYTYDNYVKPKCITCKYRNVCMKGCIGSQYEVFADPDYSIPDVCDLLKAKYDVLFNFYHSIGLFHCLFTEEPNYPLNLIFKNILIDLGYVEYQHYKFKEQDI